MSKTALDYALETIEEYTKLSVNNPDNKFRIPYNDEKEIWKDQLEKMSIQIKLDTILERLPYEINGVKDVKRTK
jgi:hypothetical protein